jgi:hypothetical protein
LDELRNTVTRAKITKHGDKALTGVVIDPELLA